MGAMEVIFDQPERESPVEHHGIDTRIALGDEFFLDRPIEPLTHGVVLRCVHAIPPMLQFEILHGFLEVLVKFGAIVCLHVDNVSIDEHVEPAKEIGSTPGTVARIHPREG